MRNAALHILAAVVALTLVGQVHAQTPVPGVYIIFDGSGSMWGQLADSSYKIEVAKSVLREFVTRDFPGSELALRAYGHRREADCTDTELVVPFGAPATVAERIAAFLARINPLGRTPINRSLQAAIDDFGNRSGEIILISDGIETCNADPCALVADWRRNNVAIRVHVVGFGVQEEEQQALRCIANAAGTGYHDASNAQELAQGLAAIYEGTVSAAVHLVGVDASGNELPVAGTLTGDGKIFEIASNRRNHVDAGDYELVAGVRTADGTLYQPVSVRATVLGQGDTHLRVEVAPPPTVHARFRDTAGPTHRAMVSAYQDGREVFRFRPIDTVYVQPGAYEFRSTPNAANELTVSANVPPGQATEVLFELIRTVKVTFRMEASESGILFRENYELWRDGELRYRVHRVNGARVLPGTYDLRLPNRLTPYIESGIVITDEDDQHFTVTVPVGHVTFVYATPDGSVDSDDRLFVSRAGGNEQIYLTSGARHPLTAGTYVARGWTRKGEYEPVTFAVAVGDEKRVVLRAK